MQARWTQLIILSSSIITTAQFHPQTQPNPSSNLTILHYHHRPPPPDSHASTIPTSRLMSSCPAPSTFLSSQCNPSTSPQALTVLCADRDPSHPQVQQITTHPQSCQATEFCIDLRPDQDLEAYCVPPAAFSDLVPSISPDDDPLHAVTWLQIPIPEFSSQPPRLRSAHARLIGKYTPTPLRANYLGLVAWRVVSHVSRLSAEVRCEKCLDLRMEPVPKGSRIFIAEVGAGKEVGELGGGVLVLVTVE